ncbi:MAG: tRNA (adenosine(37)-N6)-threonylcarbamoyltransferase complex ATPase subunit type 1 TsaE [Acidimicrobiales bacterium]
MIIAITKNAPDTQRLAEALAGLISQGDVIVLAGDLGAGKTAFTQGLARGLGVAEQVTSPTFTLARSYDCHNRDGMRLHHLDMYRIDHLQEALDMGLADEFVDDEAVTVIEWGDVVTPAIPSSFLEIRLTYGEDDDERRLLMHLVGPSWVQRAVSLQQLLGLWLVDG